MIINTYLQPAAFSPNGDGENSYSVKPGRIPSMLILRLFPHPMEMGVRERLEIVLDDITAYNLGMTLTAKAGQSIADRRNQSVQQPKP